MSSPSLKRPGDDLPAPSPKKLKPDYKETITVLIGAEEQSLLAYKDTICAKSEYFKAACSKDWVEGQEGIVRLPETEPYLFWAFLHWAYTNEIELPLIHGCSFASWQDQGKLWALGDYLQSSSLRNAVSTA